MAYAGTPSLTASLTSFSSDCDNDLQERVQRFADAQESMRNLLDTPDRWAESCETVFNKFRQSTVHLKKEKHVLDEVDDKESVVRFMAKFCKDRPVFRSRSEEVLLILLGSEAFKKAFRNTDLEALPPNVRKDLLGSVECADSDNGGMVATVERCSWAKLRVDSSSDSWSDIQQGLVIRVSFAAGAGDKLAISVARSLLLAKLSAAAPHDRHQLAESVVELGRRGVAQGVMIVPQTCLLAQLGKTDGQLTYPALTVEDDRGRLYDTFVQAVRDAAKELVVGGDEVQLPQIVAGRFGDPQSWEIKSEGFMHSFSF